MQVAIGQWQKNGSWLVYCSPTHLTFNKSQNLWKCSVLCNWQKMN